MAYGAKNYAQAAAYYRDAIQTDPDFTEAYQALGNCELRIGKKAEALTQYEKALALNPDNPLLSQMVDFLSEKAPESAETPVFSPTLTSSLPRI